MANSLRYMALVVTGLALTTSIMARAEPGRSDADSVRAIAPTTQSPQAAKMNDFSSSTSPKRVLPQPTRVDSPIVTATG